MNAPRRLALLLAHGLALGLGLVAPATRSQTPAARSQTPAPQATAPQTAAPQPAAPRQTSRPYTGDLSIFESPGRDQRLQIDRVMDLLGIQAGKNVADIGAGSGWFTVRASRRVGPTGAVLAEDINPLAIEAIGKRVNQENLANVRTVLGRPDDPMLPPGSVDAVLLLKVYHEIDHSVTFMKNLRPALRKGAKVGIIDRNGSGSDHGVDHKIVVKEMGEAGFRLAASYDFTKADGQDYFLIYEAQQDQR